MSESGRTGSSSSEIVAQSSLEAKRASELVSKAEARNRTIQTEE